METVAYYCKPCNVLSFHALDQEPLFCVSCLKCDDGTTALVLDAVPPAPVDLDMPVIDSPAIRRIMDEVRNSDADGVPRSYDRSYNRHNR